MQQKEPAGQECSLWTVSPYAQYLHIAVGTRSEVIKPNNQPYITMIAKTSQHSSDWKSQLTR